jgi:anti-anti-sigma factor
MKLADLDVEVRDRIVIAHVSGEIDMSNAGALKAALAEQITNEALGLVIDLSDLRYVDSVGIQLLYELRKQLKTRGQKLALVVPSGSVTEKTLQLVNAAEFLGMSCSASAAAAAVTSS